MYNANIVEIFIFHLYSISFKYSKILIFQHIIQSIHNSINSSTICFINGNV
ncbi:MAG: hypothetical protein Q8S84_05095 [bacterium]|nr:hypothetical protein [bacterium]